MDIYISKNEEQLGPFDEEQLAQQIAQGAVSHDDLAWVEGMTEWRPLRELIAGADAGEPAPQNTIVGRKRGLKSTLFVGLALILIAGAGIWFVKHKKQSIASKDALYTYRERMEQIALDRNSRTGTDSPNDVSVPAASQKLESEPESQTGTDLMGTAADSPTSSQWQADAERDIELIDQIYQATTLDSQAKELEHAKKFREAIPIATKVLQLRAQAFGTNSVRYGDTLRTLAGLYLQIGDEKTTRIYDQLNENLYSKLDKGPTRANFSDLVDEAVNKLKPKNQQFKSENAKSELAVEVYEFIVNSSTMRRYLDESSEIIMREKLNRILKKLYEPNDLRIADNSSKLANFYNEAALNKYQAQVKHLTDRFGKKTGNYQEAVIAQEKVCVICKKLYGPNDLRTADNSSRLAGFYKEVGEYAKAEAIYRELKTNKIFEISVPTVPTRGTATRTKRSEESFTHKMQREAISARIEADSSMKLAMPSDGASPFSDSETSLKTKIARNGSNSMSSVYDISRLAMIYEKRGDYAKAEPLLLHSLQITETGKISNQDQIIGPIFRLASLYEKMGDHAKAEPYIQRASKMLEKGDSPYLVNLGNLYQMRGDFAKAEPLYLRGIKSIENTYGPEHTTTAMFIFHGLVALYKNMGDYSKVVPLLQRVLKIYENAYGQDNREVATVRNDLCYAYLRLNQPVEARLLAIQMGQTKEKLLNNILAFTSEEQRSTFQKSMDPYSLYADLGQVPDLAQAILRCKAIVLDSLVEDRLVAAASHDPAQHKAITQLAAAKQQLMQLSLETPKDSSAETTQEHTTKLEAVSKQVDELEASLARQVAGLGNARRALRVTVPQVQAAMAADQVLIEFLRYNHYLGKNIGPKTIGPNGEPQWNKFEMRYGAVAIGRTGEPQWIALGKADEIEKNLKLFQQHVRNSKTAEAAQSALLQTLHQQLWAPIEKVLPAATHTVILSPDGELNFLSFATLLTPDNQFLGEKYSLRHVASGRDLLQKFKIAPKPVVSIYANPDFNAANGQVAVTNGPAPAAGDGLAMRSLEMRDFSNINLPPLPGTQQEGTALATQLKQSGMETELFLGPQATEAQLRQITSPRILHLATHGFFLPDTELEQSTANDNQRGMSVAPAGGDNSMNDFGGGAVIPNAMKNPMRRSGLALAGAQQTFAAWSRGGVPPTDNDGILTAEEVGGLHLNGTWLVTLSACETGVGEARAGEGVLGLRRGFIQAGTQNLLMTLWPVADEETVKLMTDFYKVAQQTGNAPQALANVQRDSLVKLRRDKGLWFAVNRAGPFIMSSQGLLK